MLLVLATTDVDAAAADALFARALEGRACVHDLRYGPRTRAVRDAALRARHLYADGTTMLLAQAERALELFLGETLPDVARRAMAGAVSESLKRA
jgi:shikimate 5-dehydrogenase